MYLLPKSFTGSFLIGQRVEVLSFCQFHFDIYFSNKCWIHVESGYCLYMDKILVEEVSEFPLKSTVLLQLLERTVSDVQCVDRTNLKLFFETLVLEINGDIGPYEAYRISDGNDEFLV